MQRENISANSGKTRNLQDLYLNYLRKNKIPVTIYLTKGVRLRGVIKGFDSFIVILKEAAQQMIYKHAISTVAPEMDIDLRFEDEK